MKIKYLLIGLLIPLIIGAVYKIQSDNLLVGTDTGGEKAITFQTGRAVNPKVYIDQATPDSLRFTEENIVLGKNDTAAPSTGYSFIFQSQGQPDHALPGLNFDGTKLQIRNTVGDVWDLVATGYGLNRDQNKFMDEALRIDSRTDVPITDFGTEGYFLWKVGARSPNLSDYQTGTTISHGNSAFPVLYGIVIKDNFTILRFEDAATQGTIAATLDTQVPISGYKRYAVTFPARADIGTYVAIVSEGQPEKYSFTSDVVINRNNLSQELGQAIGGGSPQPGNNPTNAHTRFVQDLGYTIADSPAWTSIRNHPNYRPYNFERLAASFWGENNKRTPITNYFEDVSGVLFSLAGGQASATFGHGTGWNSHPSFASDIVTITNSSIGTHGGVELTLGDFIPYGGSTRWIFPSVGLTSTTGGGSSATISNFNTEKRFDLKLGNRSILGRIVRIYTSNTQRIQLLTSESVGNLTLYIDGNQIGPSITGSSGGTQRLNDQLSGTWQYDFGTQNNYLIDSDSKVAFGGNGVGAESLSMYLVNPENTVRFGEFDRHAGGPFTNSYRKAIGFDFRLTLPTGNEELLVIGGAGTTADIGGGGDTVSQQTVLGYDELGSYLMQGSEDGSNVANPPKEITYLQKTFNTSPRTICKLVATAGGLNPVFSNDCQFNVSTPTNGNTKLVLMGQFVNTALDSAVQSLPVTLLDMDITIGTNASKTVSVTMPRGLTSGFSNTETFNIAIAYTGSNNNVTLTIDGDNEPPFLSAADRVNVLSLQFSLVSEQENNRVGNNSYESSQSRIWTSINENQTQSVVLWFHPEDNQSPNETDPYLTVRGEINGRGFHFDLKRRASDFDFSNIKFGNSAIDVSHIQVYSYDYVQNRVTDIYRPNDSAMPDNMYEHINSWIGQWNHPTEDVGEFIIDDNVKVTGELSALGIIKNSYSEQSEETRIEYCQVTNSGTLVANSGCDTWATSARVQNSSTSCRLFIINFNTAFFDYPICFSEAPYSAGAFQDSTTYVVSQNSFGVSARICNGTPGGSFPNATLSIVCVGR